MNSFQCLGGKLCKEIYDIIQETNSLLNINDKKLFDETLELLYKYDTSICYSDCTTIKMMKKHKIMYHMIVILIKKKELPEYVT